MSDIFARRYNVCALTQMPTQRRLGRINKTKFVGSRRADYPQFICCNSNTL